MTELELRMWALDCATRVAPRHTDLSDIIDMAEAIVRFVRRGIGGPAIATADPTGDPPRPSISHPLA